MMIEFKKRPRPLRDSFTSPTHFSRVVGNFLYISLKTPASNFSATSKGVVEDDATGLAKRLVTLLKSDLSIFKGFLTSFISIIFFTGMRLPDLFKTRRSSNFFKSILSLSFTDNRISLSSSPLFTL